MEQAEGMQYQETPAASIPVQQEAAQEKMLPQSEVNRIISDQKLEAYERGKREALAAAQQAQQPADGRQQGMGGMQQMPDEKIRQMIAEEAEKRANMEMAQRFLNDFSGKMEAGKGKFTDFEQTIAELDLQSNPYLVQLANNVGNTSDVMYHLGKNPSKVATLTTLAYVNPRLAQMEMQKLSDSITKNESAANIPDAPEPLSQLKPSTIGTDNGSNSIRDLRRKSWARG